MTLVCYSPCILLNGDVISALFTAQDWTLNQLDSPGSLPQKGITTYALSANRQRPLAGTMHAAIFNTFRRFRQSVLYVVPPFVVGYMLMDWATKRCLLYLDQSIMYLADPYLEMSSSIPRRGVRSMLRLNKLHVLP